MTSASLCRQSMERTPQAGDSLRETMLANLAALKRHGVTLAVGSDIWDDDSVGEVMFLAETGALTNEELLRAWSVNAAQTILPHRRVGRLEAGYETSFLVLDGDPFEDFAQVRRIALRFKQGRPLLLD